MLLAAGIMECFCKLSKAFHHNYGEKVRKFSNCGVKKQVSELNLGIIIPVKITSPSDLNNHLCDTTDANSSIICSCLVNLFQSTAWKCLKCQMIIFISIRGNA